MKTDRTILFENGAGVNTGALENFTNAARKAAGLRGQVSVLITSNARIRELNHRFRSKDSATDVLSFPAAGANGFAGDIAISHEIAAHNARELGHSVEDEIRILILHGILHLAGYDHEEDKGVMERKESALRKRLGLNTGLIERSLRANAPLTAGPRSSTGSSHRGKSSVRLATRGARRRRT